MPSNSNFGATPSKLSRLKGNQTTDLKKKNSKLGGVPWETEPQKLS
jgi:hypothetical protein